MTLGVFKQMGLFHANCFCGAFLHAGLAVYTELGINFCNIMVFIKFFAILHGNRGRWTDIHTRFTSGALFRINLCWHTEYFGRK